MIGQGSYEVRPLGTHSGRFRKWVWGLLLLPVVLIGIGVWVSFGWLAHKALQMSQYAPVARTLPAEIAAARREGLPLEPNDLRPPSPVPDSQNAAPLYSRITNEFNALPKAQRDAEGETAIAILHTTRTEADRAKARALLLRCAPQMRLAEQAALLPRCDFHRPYEQGPNMMIPEYATARQFARLFALRAILESDAGQPEAALRSIAIGARIGRHMSEDPILIALLVRIAIQAIMDRAFQVVVLKYQDRPDILRLAAQTNRAFDPPPDVRHAFRGEMVMCRVCVDMVRSTPSWISFLPLSARARAQSRQVRRDMCDAWEARMLAYWRRVFAGLRAHPGDLIAQYRALKPLGDQEEANDGKPTYELSAILMPVFSRVVLKVAACEAKRRLRKTILALIAYRQKTGQFPASLTDLPAPLPPDIFTSRPLFYRRTGQGFILYSVGENFRDDGGKAKSEKKGEGLPDIAIQYPVAY
jgi:hypothetical protein